MKGECETEGGRKELERLARFAAIGRIELQDVEGETLGDQTSLARDERIKQNALKYNAILITADNTMKAYAQSKDLFCLHV